MTTYNVQGTVSNGTLVANFSAVITAVLAPVISTVTITPNPASTGTLRTIAVTATDPQGLPLTYTLTVPGLTVSTTSQPNIFTVVA